MDTNIARIRAQDAAGEVASNPSNPSPADQRGKYKFPLMEIARAVAQLAGQRDGMTLEQLHAAPCPLENGSPLVLAARGACLERGYLADGSAPRFGTPDQREEAHTCTPADERALYADPMRALQKTFAERLYGSSPDIDQRRDALYTMALIFAAAETDSARDATFEDMFNEFCAVPRLSIFDGLTRHTGKEIATNYTFETEEFFEVEAVERLLATHPAPVSTAAAPVSEREQFCDSHCVLADHHPDCTILKGVAEVGTAAAPASASGWQARRYCKGDAEWTNWADISDVDYEKYKGDATFELRRAPTRAADGQQGAAAATASLIELPELNPKELRIDTFCTSPAGGFNRGPGDIAVRITHMPTGITAQSSTELSQKANRDVAMLALRKSVHKHAAPTPPAGQQGASSAVLDVLEMERTGDFSLRIVFNHKESCDEFIAAQSRAQSDTTGDR
jgi:hypothetical protein